MLGSRHLVLTLGFLGAIFAGCGPEAPSTTDTTSSSSSSSGSSSSSSSSSSSGGGEGGAPACPTNEGVVLAVQELYFGEGNSGEWKKVGYNLDGLTSTAQSKDLCKLSSGASASTPYPDGDGGIDNSFGKNLLPTILSLYPTWVTDINNGIQNGRFTALVKMLCLPPEGDAPQLTTQLFAGTSLGGGSGNPPKYDGTDKWPVEPGLLSDPMDPLSASVVFKNSSVVGNVFDAGKDAIFVISVPVRTMTSSTSIKLTLYNARIKMNLAADRKSATGGMIGGVLNTEEFVAEMSKVGLLLGLCGNPLFDNLVAQVRQASDILADGTQDPNKECDGITMGLGFDMYGANIGDVGPANPVGMGCP
jgi:hypothetical protein